MKQGTITWRNKLMNVFPWWESPTISNKARKFLNKKSKKQLIDLILSLTWEIHKAKLPRLKKVYDFETKKLTSGIKRKTKRKFSRKQLAAQRLFAKRARAGTLRKRRRR